MPFSCDGRFGQLRLLSWWHADAVGERTQAWENTPVIGTE
jgi:hypothetical protein